VPENTDHRPSRTSASRVGTEAFGARFALASLAIWRLTHLISEEDGPADIVIRLRRRAGDGWLGELMDCFQCLSLWVAAPFALLVSPRRRKTPLIWLALSGAACLLEQRSGERETSTEPKGGNDGLLWPETESVKGE
jgi:uncharacterized protein DUF1360